MHINNLLQEVLKKNMFVIIISSKDKSPANPLFPSMFIHWQAIHMSIHPAIIFTNVNFKHKRPVLKCVSLEACILKRINNTSTSSSNEIS